MAKKENVSTLVSKIKLLPSPEQASLIDETMRVFNETCNEICERAFAEKTFSKFGIQKLLYYDIIGGPLSSQMVLRAIGKVAGQFSREKKRHRFRPDGAILYDRRLYTLKQKRTVSLWLLGGRSLVAIKPTKQQLATALAKPRQVSLLKEKGSYYLIVTYRKENANELPQKGVIGVDFGIKNTAVTSCGKRFSGDDVERARKRYARLKAALQRRGTKSAKRKLKKIAKKEARFRASVNHTISKRIVAAAKGTGSMIALEDLKGIGSRTTVSKAQRARHKGWAFFQLRSFIEYKAALEGIAVAAVDPAYTSQQCPACGHVSRSNRPRRDLFSCTCGHTGHADHVAAINIASRAAAVRPHASLPIVAGVDEEGSSRLLFVPHSRVTSPRL